MEPFQEYNQQLFPMLDPGLSSNGSKFCFSKIEILAKNKHFDKKIKILAKDWNFGKAKKFWQKIEILAKKSKY